MDIHKVETTITTAGGNGSHNTLPIIGGLCRHIFIQPESSGTIYDFAITNDSSLEVRGYDNITDTLNDDSRILPMRGIYTVSVQSANQDSLFNILFMVQQ